MSLVLILPFVVMEIVNRRDLPEGFPFFLFGLMWLLTLVLIVTGTPVLRNARAGKPAVLLVRLVVAVAIITILVGITVDQMPCFLGVPNCD